MYESMSWWERGPPWYGEDCGLARRKAPQLPSRRLHLQAQLARSPDRVGETAKMVGLAPALPYRQ
jgi:hypothetical protein